MTEEQRNNAYEGTVLGRGSALARFDRLNPKRPEYTTPKQLENKGSDDYVNPGVEIPSTTNREENIVNLPKRGLLVKSLSVAAATGLIAIGVSYSNRSAIADAFNYGIDTYMGKNQVSFPHPDLTDAERFELIINSKIRSPGYVENVLNNSIRVLENKENATPQDKLNLEALKEKRQDFLSGKIKITSLEDLTWNKDL